MEAIAQSKITNNMKQFTSLRNCKLSPEDMADVLESYVAGVDPVTIAEKHSSPLTTISTYIYRHYHGIVPKENQIRITLKSRV